MKTEWRSTAFRALADGRFTRPEAARAAASHLELRSGERLLDVGGGSGAHSTWIALRTGARATVLDPEARVAIPGIAVRRARAEVRQPDFDGAFDAALSASLVHHLDDRARLAVFGNVRGYLRPSHRYAILTASHADLRQRPLQRYFPSALALDLARYPATRDLEEELSRAGFREVSVRPVTLGVVPFDERVLRFCEERIWSALRLLDPAEVEGGIRRLRSDLATGGPAVGWVQRRTLVLACA